MELAGVGKKEIDKQDVNGDGCQQPLIEKRLHLLYSLVAHRIKLEIRGM